MDDADERLDAMIDAAASALGIGVAPEWRGAVRQHLAISLAHAANVTSFPLDDEAEPAPVFHP